MKRVFPLLLSALFSSIHTHACEADFTYSIDGLTINLDGSASAGDITSWHWFINNDFFSDAGPETHITVADTGEYWICLVIETASGCVDTFCHGVNVEAVGNNCEAAFTWNVDGFTINLNGNTSSGDVVSWHWYINNDLFSDAGPETHITVGDTGEYWICLVIETASGCVDTFCHGVNVEAVGNNCEAAFTWNVDGFTINLNGNTSSGDVVSWHWFINNDFFSDAGPETHITVGDTGEYWICLVIETASGCVDTFCHGVNVEVVENNCEAAFTWNVDGFTINLNGNTSSGDVISWHWYINNDLFSDAGPETHTTVTDSGDYEICLIIETASGCIDTFCSTTSVALAPFEGFNFKILPPSADGSLQLLLSSPDECSAFINVLDLSGRKIFAEILPLSPGTISHTLPLQNRLAAGFYLLTIDFNGMFASSGIAAILR